MDNVRIVVGSSDREMQTIESLARSLGIKVVWATMEGGRQRVNPGTAYDAVHPRPQEGDIWVECRLAGHSKRDLESLGCSVADHHDAADPATHASARDFLRGSSLGQVVALLAVRGIDPGAEHLDLPAGVGIGTNSFWFDGDNWWLALPGVSVRIPDEVVYVAAADHCLVAAYAGSCPGVDPKTLWSLRTGGACAPFRSMILSDLEFIPRVSIGGVEVLDFRSHWCDPELGEVLSMFGIPYLFGGYGKVTLKGDNSGEAVEAIIAWGTSEGHETFGSPARGFAGVNYGTVGAMLMG